MVFIFQKATNRVNLKRLTKKAEIFSNIAGMGEFKKY